MEPVGGIAAAYEMQRINPTSKIIFIDRLPWSPVC